MARNRDPSIWGAGEATRPCECGYPLPTPPSQGARSAPLERQLNFISSSRYRGASVLENAVASQSRDTLFACFRFQLTPSNTWRPSQFLWLLRMQPLATIRPPPLAIRTLANRRALRISSSRSHLPFKSATLTRHTHRTPQTQHTQWPAAKDFRITLIYSHITTPSRGSKCTASPY